MNVEGIDPVNFYSSCISLSRPCTLYGMAKTWPASKKWSYLNGGTEYLAKKLNDTEVQVFENDDPHIHPERHIGYSFRKDYAV